MTSTILPETPQNTDHIPLEDREVLQNPLSMENREDDSSPLTDTLGGIVDTLTILDVLDVF